MHPWIGVMGVEKCSQSTRNTLVILPRTCEGLCPGGWERGCLAGWYPDQRFSDGTALPGTHWAPDWAVQCAPASGEACGPQPRSPTCPGHPQLRLWAQPLLPRPLCLQLRAPLSRQPLPWPPCDPFSGDLGGRGGEHIDHFLPSGDESLLLLFGC